MHRLQHPFSYKQMLQWFLVWGCCKLLFGTFLYMSFSNRLYWFERDIHLALQAKGQGLHAWLHRCYLGWLRNILVYSHPKRRRASWFLRVHTKQASGQLSLCSSDDVWLVIFPIAMDCNFSIFFELSVHSLQSFSSLGLYASLSSRDCGVYKLSSPRLQWLKVCSL